MRLDFPGVTVTVAEDALVLYSPRPLRVLASAVVGGGFGAARYILNRQVASGYAHADPAGDLVTFAARRGITEPFVGLMTAVPVQNTRAVTISAGGLTVAALVTAGLGHPTAPGLSPPVKPTPGTINLILLTSANLSSAALVNAVITATEVKAQALLARGVRTREGHPATGTSTDAVVVACTGDEGPLPYAGAATPVGWLLGRCTRAALEAALG